MIKRTQLMPVSALKAFCRPLASVFYLLIPFLFTTSASYAAPEPKGIFSGKYKIECRGSDTGCACFKDSSSSSAEVDRLYHLEPLNGISGKDESVKKADEGKPAKPVTYAQVKSRNGKTCFYDTQKLRPIYWANTNCPDESTFSKLPFASLETIIKTGSKNNTKAKSFKVYPTFYYVADEAFYGTRKTERLYQARTGKRLATVNKEYRVDLDIQGTGKLNDGRVLNVWKYTNRIWDYVVLPKGSYGLGIHDHYLFPFRTVAIDFTYLCQQAGLKNCSGNRATDKKRFIGSLLYISQLDGTALPNGKTHDGYVCAHDVGGAIKSDRIDLFVGNMGGGNPYLPECRSRNAYMDNGIESLVPYDWKLFDKNGRVRQHEYRTTAAHKGLDVQVVKGTKCKNIW
ncbi:3D domain-containing protein [bacterium]|nr:3D domain-containing protein [bacterium]